jgi:hypothetical protein
MDRSDGYSPQLYVEKRNGRFIDGGKSMRFALSRSSCALSRRGQCRVQHANAAMDFDATSWFGQPHCPFSSWYTYNAKAGIHHAVWRDAETRVRQ